MNRRSFFTTCATIAGAVALPAPAPAHAAAQVPRIAALGMHPPYHPNCRCIIAGEIWDATPRRPN